MFHPSPEWIDPNTRRAERTADGTESEALDRPHVDELATATNEVFLLVLLKQNDVSLIWPLTSLGFVLTALSAKFILHEEVSVVRWGGVLLIVIGAGLVSWSEKQKERRQPEPPPAESIVSRQ